MTKKIFTIGIIICILYFISVGLFLITKTEIALTIWEFMTVLSAPVLLLVLLEISTLVAITSIYKKAMLAFMSCGILCLIGFFGTIFINKNIWYVAPMGYGIGTMIVCIQMLKFRTIR